MMGGKNEGQRRRSDVRLTLNMAAASPSVISGSDTVLIAKSFRFDRDRSLAFSGCLSLSDEPPPSPLDPSPVPGPAPGRVVGALLEAVHTSRRLDITPQRERDQKADPLSKGGLQRTAITREWTMGGRSLETCRPGLWAPAVARCGSVSEGASNRPATQVGVGPDAAPCDGAIPCSGGLAAIPVPSLFGRRALIPAMVRRAASRRVSLAGCRHGLVPIRNGQAGHLTAVQRATSLA